MLYPQLSGTSGSLHGRAVSSPSVPPGRRVTHEAGLPPAQFVPRAVQVPVPFAAAPDRQGPGGCADPLGRARRFRGSSRAVTAHPAEAERCPAPCEVLSTSAMASRLRPASRSAPDGAALPCSDRKAKRRRSIEPSKSNVRIHNNESPPPLRGREGWGVRQKSLVCATAHNPSP